MEVWEMVVGGGAGGGRVECCVIVICIVVHRLDGGVAEVAGETRGVRAERERD